MMNFNSFLYVVGTVMVLGLSYNGANSGKIKCPIQFPDGFFCDLICQDWTMLTGNTMMCFISNDGEYQRYLVRNPALGIWRFYKVDITTQVESLCENSVIGDEFFLSNSSVLCSSLKPRPKRYHTHTPSKYQYGDSSHPIKAEIDINVPLHSICELTIAQVCHQGKIINCERSDACCYDNLLPSVCLEGNLHKFRNCYKGLFSVFNSTI